MRRETFVRCRKEVIEQQIDQIVTHLTASITTTHYRTTEGATFFFPASKKDIDDDGRAKETPSTAKVVVLIPFFSSRNPNKS